MDFRNDEDMFDFSELPSASGTYGYYGTNHLKDDCRIAAAKSMEYIMNEIEIFKGNLELDFSDCIESERKMKIQFAEKILDDLLFCLSYSVADLIVSFGDSEVELD